MKNYVRWTPVKIEIEMSGSIPIGYSERDIWLCSIGENIGSEEDGKGSKFIRPVIILKAYSRSFCHVVPLSTTKKRSKFYFAFDGNTGKISVALLTQSRAISASRLHRVIGTVAEKDFVEIKSRIRGLLGL